jgi:hypothetical protein
MANILDALASGRPDPRGRFDILPLLRFAFSPSFREGLDRQKTIEQLTQDRNRQAAEQALSSQERLGQSATDAGLQSLIGTGQRDLAQGRGAETTADRGAFQFDLEKLVQQSLTEGAGGVPPQVTDVRTRQATELENLTGARARNEAFPEELSLRLQGLRSGLDTESLNQQVLQRSLNAPDEGDRKAILQLVTSPNFTFFDPEFQQALLRGLGGNVGQSLTLDQPSGDKSATAKKILETMLELQRAKQTESPSRRSRSEEDILGIRGDVLSEPGSPPLGALLREPESPTLGTLLRERGSSIQGAPSPSTRFSDTFKQLGLAPSSQTTIEELRQIIRDAAREGR